MSMHPRNLSVRRGAMPLGLGLALVMSASLWAQPADATVVKALSLREKAQVAPVILHGIVQRVDVQWKRPGAFVQTLISVKVIEALKGGHEAGEIIIVYRGGGRIGDFNQTAAGLSEYEPGEELVLFLEPLGATYVGIGIGIAKYPVSIQRGERTVTHNPNVSGVTFIEGSPPIIEHILPMAPTPLPAFLKTLRSYIRKIPTQARPMPRKGAYLKAKPIIPTLQSR